MNYSKNHRMAGHWHLISKTEDKLEVHVVGFKRDNLKQTDVNYICSFHHFPWTEKWLIEGEGTYDYKVVIKKEEHDHETH